MKKHRHLFKIFIIIFSILFLIPIWSVRYVPLQDWPVFIGFSYIISHLSNFSLLSVKPIPPPYTTGFLLLAGLMRIFPPLIAGKVLLSIYIISFFASFYYYLRILNPKGLFLYFFAPLLVFNNFFAKGNINFILSIPLFLFIVPFFLKRLNNYRRYYLLIVFFLSLVLYFTHLFTYLVFLLIVLFVISFRKKGIPLFAVSFIPLFFFIGYFLINRAPLELSLYSSFFTKYLSFRDTFGTWTPYFDVAILAVPFLLFFFLVISGWRKKEKEWKLILAVLFLLYLLAPMELYTLSRPDQRFLPFAFFVLLLFPESKKGIKYIFPAFLASLSLINFVIKERVFVTLQPRIERCIRVISSVPRDKAVVSFGTKEYYIGVINPFLHILAYTIPLKENIYIPTYEWNVPLFINVRLPGAKIEGGKIRNRKELLSLYDYFFVMEDGDSFERELENFTEQVILDDGIKLFKKK
ncbi:MAG: hypothetical protein E3J87_10840 [Candidatus Cloacimonadota bacterium]|nr:MAG: hypothetical protein E3J87_10840 [Candidatus Cloacimonadota bacterium]